MTVFGVRCYTILTEEQFQYYKKFDIRLFLLLSYNNAVFFQQTTVPYIVLLFMECLFFPIVHSHFNLAVDFIKYYFVIYIYIYIFVLYTRHYIIMSRSSQCIFNTDLNTKSIFLPFSGMILSQCIFNTDLEYKIHFSPFLVA